MSAAPQDADEGSGGVRREICQIIDDDACYEKCLDACRMKTRSWAVLRSVVTEREGETRRDPHMNDIIHGFDWGDRPASRSRLKKLAETLMEMQKELAALSEVAVARTGPLHEAVVAGDVDACKALCAGGGGAASHQPDSLGRSPLCLACALGHAEIACALLGCGATHHADDKGRSPLHYAAMFGHAALCTLLLERGANAHGEHPPPLLLAAKFGHPRVCEILGPLMSARVLSTALAHAAGRARPGTCAALIAKGASCNPDGRDGESSPLLLAARAASPATCDVLIKAGASVYDGDVSDDPLAGACEAGSVVVVNLLLDRGTVFDAFHATEFGGLTYCGPAPYASRAIATESEADAIDVCDALIRRGFPLASVRSGYGAAVFCVMLAEATSLGRADLLEMLLDRIVNVGRIPLSDVVQSDQSSRCGVLKSAAACGSIRMCTFLLAKGFAYHRQEGYSKWSAVCVACEKGHLDICRLLNEHGANLACCVDDEIRSMRGCRYIRTPMQVAAKRGHSHIVEFLLSKGIPAHNTLPTPASERPSNWAWTDDEPLFIAAKAGHAQVCARLIRAGADPRPRGRFVPWRPRFEVLQFSRSWTEEDRRTVERAIRDSRSVRARDRMT